MTVLQLRLDSVRRTIAATLLILHRRSDELLAGCIGAQLLGDRTDADRGPKTVSFASVRQYTVHHRPALSLFRLQCGPAERRQVVDLKSTITSRPLRLLARVCTLPLALLLSTHGARRDLDTSARLLARARRR